MAERQLTRREELILAAEAAAELERRRKVNGIKYYQPHKKQLDFHRCKKRVRFTFGGNRTGKTVSGAAEAVWFATGEHPYRQIQPSNGWVVSLTFDVQVSVAQPEIMRWLPERFIKKTVYRGRGIIDTIYLTNGKKITFKSVEMGREAFQGASLGWVWFDEEPPLDIYRECQMRVMDQQGDIWMTLTPLKGLTWLYGVAWQNEANDPQIWKTVMTWDDNPYLSEEEKQRLRSVFDEYELDAREHGNFLLPGGMVFDKRRVGEMITQVEPPIARYSFDGLDSLNPDDWQIVEDEQGELWVWELPEAGQDYDIGADVAEGLQSGDFSTAVVGRHDTGNPVCDLQTHMTPDTFARALYALGRWYNWAFLGPEMNKDGSAVLNVLINYFPYPELYYHDGYNKEAGKNETKPGWPTNSQTRPIMIAGIQAAIKEGWWVVKSSRLIGEFQTFVRGKDGKPTAQGKGEVGGCKDDLVFAAGIMLQLRERRSGGDHVIMPEVLNTPMQRWGE